jgi:hypothetical protein
MTMRSDAGRLNRPWPARTVRWTGWWTAVADFLRRIEQASCGLRGHDELTHFSPRRLSLRCVRCGHQSAGWEICPLRVGVVAGVGRRSTA